MRYLWRNVEGIMVICLAEMNGVCVCVCVCVCRWLERTLKVLLIVKTKTLFRIFWGASVKMGWMLDKCSTAWKIIRILRLQAVWLYTGCITKQDASNFQSYIYRIINFSLYFLEISASVYTFCYKQLKSHSLLEY